MSSRYAINMFVCKSYHDVRIIDVVIVFKALDTSVLLRTGALPGFRLKHAI